MPSELFTIRQREILFRALDMMYGEATRTEEDGESVPPYSSAEIAETYTRLQSVT